MSKQEERLIEVIDQLERSMGEKDQRLSALTDQLRHERVSDESLRHKNIEIAQLRARVKELEGELHVTKESLGILTRAAPGGEE